MTSLSSVTYMEDVFPDDVILGHFADDLENYEGNGSLSMEGFLRRSRDLIKANIAKADSRITENAASLVTLVSKVRNELADFINPHKELLKT